MRVIGWPGFLFIAVPNPLGDERAEVAERSTTQDSSATRRTPSISSRVPPTDQTVRGRRPRRVVPSRPSYPVSLVLCSSPRRNPPSMMLRAATRCSERHMVAIFRDCRPPDSSLAVKWACVGWTNDVRLSNRIRIADGIETTVLEEELARSTKLAVEVRRSYRRFGTDAASECLVRLPVVRVQCRADASARAAAQVWAMAQVYPERR
jgi:hypothetical protein